MKKIEVLNSEELMKVSGGSLSVGGWFALGGGVIFAIGIIDGILRPLKCN